MTRRKQAERLCFPVDRRGRHSRLFGQTDRHPDRHGRGLSIISGVRVLKHSEPILLAGIPESTLLQFIAQYTGKRGDAKLEIGSGGLDAISGATVTVIAENQVIFAQRLRSRAPGRHLQGRSASARALYGAERSPVVAAAARRRQRGAHADRPVPGGAGRRRPLPRHVFRPPERAVGGHQPAGRARLPAPDGRPQARRASHFHHRRRPDLVQGVRLRARRHLRPHPGAPGSANLHLPRHRLPEPVRHHAADKCPRMPNRPCSSCVRPTSTRPGLGSSPSWPTRSMRAAAPRPSSISTRLTGCRRAT
ncbi:hypothetical protein LP419_12420 [Massilia sp. H-1]|nr:hypothetical protein LP419_12420 [Massilia sp. H-1]